MTGRVLPAMDTAERAGRLRDRLAEAGCEALLVTELANIRYLTGFSGSAAMLLVLPDRLVLSTDGRYGTQAGQELQQAGVQAEVVVGALVVQRDGLVAAAGSMARLGLEAEHVSWSQQRRMAAEWFPDAELVALEGLVEQLRRTKDEGETARLAAAAAIADEALAAVLPSLEPGLSEAEVALGLEVEMRRRGAEGVSFDTIVASGPNGAKPHHRPTARVLDQGDVLTIDFGALVDGYHSDMTRTVSLGQPASDDLLRAAAVVAEAQAAGVAAVAAGVPAKDVDRACREVIEAAGLGEAFVHGTGHGVGLHIHEAPAVSSLSADTLETGDVVTVEPGVYLPEVGGVRIEDTVVVTTGGCRPITMAPKILTISMDNSTHRRGPG